MNFQNQNLAAQLKISYIEIYNECINDLLDPSKKNLDIREYKDNGYRSIVIPGLTTKIVKNAQEAFKIFEKGETSRKFASTGANSNSSRSHTIFNL